MRGAGHLLTHYLAIFLLYDRHRQGLDYIEPSSSHSEIQTRLILDQRALDLEMAIYQAKRGRSLPFGKVSGFYIHIHHGRKATSVPSRKSTLIEIDTIGNVGVERREEPYHVTDLIEGHSVEKEKIIGAIASTNIESAGKLRSARHTR